MLLLYAYVIYPPVMWSVMAFISLDSPSCEVPCWILCSVVYRDATRQAKWLYRLKHEVALKRGLAYLSRYNSGWFCHRYPETPGICPDTPDIGVRRLRTSEFCGPVTVTWRLRVYVRILRTLCPDISGRIVSHGFCRFSWAQLPCPRLWIKVPLDSTAFLYSILKIKSSLLVHLRTPLFISFLRVHASLYALLSHP
jgi:hypothetical protein